MKLDKKWAAAGVTKFRSDKLQRPSLHFQFDHFLMIIISTGLLSHHFVKQKPVYLLKNLPLSKKYLQDAPGSSSFLKEITH
jgi:hypothetical protein